MGDRTLLLDRRCCCHDTVSKHLNGRPDCLQRLEDVVREGLHPIDFGADLLGGLCGLIREILYLLCHNREALAGFPRPGLPPEKWSSLMYGF